jgi:hypothetical protein
VVDIKSLIFPNGASSDTIIDFIYWYMEELIWEILFMVM